MTPEDRITSVGLSETLKSSIENRSPINIDRGGVAKIRTALVENGCDFALSKPERESLINGKRIRLKPNENGKLLVYDPTRPSGERWIKYSDSLPQSYSASPDGSFVDRSMGLLAVLGAEKTTKLVSWCQSESETRGAPRLRGRERTQGRGLQQASADLISLVSLEGEDDGADIIQKVNKRLWKGLYRQCETEKERVELNNNFDYAAGDKPSKTLSSIHPDLLPDLVEFLMELSD